eukprot:364344-Chlamydomonas_euryale.AAC.5
MSDANTKCAAPLPAARKYAASWLAATGPAVAERQPALATSAACSQELFSSKALVLPADGAAVADQYVLTPAYPAPPTLAACSLMWRPALALLLPAVGSAVAAMFNPVRMPQVSVALLTETQVGRVVRLLRGHPNSRVARLAAALVKASAREAAADFRVGATQQQAAWLAAGRIKASITEAARTK